MRCRCPSRPAPPRADVHVWVLRKGTRHPARLLFMETPLMARVVIGDGMCVTAPLA